MLAVHHHGPFAPFPAPFNMAAHVPAHAAARGDKTALQPQAGAVAANGELNRAAMWRATEEGLA
jgi:hypothetical protein